MGRRTCQCSVSIFRVPSTFYVVNFTFYLVELPFYAVNHSLSIWLTARFLYGYVDYLYGLLLTF